MFHASKTIAGLVALCLPLAACLGPIEPAPTPTPAWLTEPPPPDVDTSRSAALRQQIGGLTTRFSMRMSATGVVCEGPQTFRRDGSYNTRLTCSDGSSVAHEGTWSVRGDQLCTQFTLSNGALSRLFCDPAQVTGSELILTGRSGAPTAYPILSRR